MARLLVQIGDIEFERVRWTIIDEAHAMAELSWQSASAEDLASLAVQNPHPVVLVIPQQWVYLTQVKLPEKAGRQVLAAIEYQIEDQLAQDIESQHFAVADVKDNPVSIAVVEKSIMDHCLELVRSCNLRLLQIVPEIFLCPWPGEGVSMIAGDDGILLRYGNYRGMKCQPAALPAMLEMIGRDVDFDRVRYYESSNETAPRLEKVEVDMHGSDTARLGLVDMPLIDLRQREYQASSEWRGIGHRWRWVAILLIALLVAGGYNRFVALQQLEDEIAAVKAEQYETVKLYLPAGTNTGDNLKKRLLERMQNLQDGSGQGFMELMLEFSKAQVEYTKVNIDRIGYQNSDLNVDLSSAQLKDIEDLHATVQKQGVEAKLENLNIKPDQISGRLVLYGVNGG